MDGSAVASGAAFGNHVARTGFATTALGSNTKLELNFVKAHASMGMACNFAI